MNAQLRRRLGGTGLLFIALFLVTSFVAPSGQSRWSAAKAVSFFSDHRTALRIEAWGTVAAIVVGLWFYWYLRDLIASTPGGRRLASIGFAGVIVFAVSGGLSAGVEFAAADVSGHVSADTVQTLNVFNVDVGSMLGAGGIIAFLLATGIAVIRTGVLARWLGWVGIVLGVAALVMPFTSGFGAALWTLLASIMLLVSKDTVTVGSGRAMEPLPIS